MIVRGNTNNPFPNSAVVESLTDHRIAMSFAVAGIRAERGIKILDCDNVVTSFPNFRDLAHKVGMIITETT